MIVVVTVMAVLSLVIRVPLAVLLPVLPKWLAAEVVLLAESLSLAVTLVLHVRPL